VAQPDMLGLLPEMLTVAQAAAVLRIHPMTAYKMTSNGTIPCVRLGRLIRVPKSALIQMIVPKGA